MAQAKVLTVADLKKEVEALSKSESKKDIVSDKKLLNGFESAASEAKAEQGNEAIEAWTTGESENKKKSKISTAQNQNDGNNKNQTAVEKKNSRSSNINDFYDKIKMNGTKRVVVNGTAPTVDAEKMVTRHFRLGGEV